MSASFKDIQEYVQGFIGDTSANTLAKVKREINKEMRRLSKERDWPELTTRIRDTLTVTSGVAYLALPGDCAQIQSIVDLTNDRPLVDKALVNLERHHVATSDTNGQVIHYSILGDLPTKRPLSQAETLTFTPSASLGAEIDIRVHGLLDTPEIPGKDAITTSTTTPVATTATFREGWSIHAIGTDGDVDTGHITVTGTTSSDVLAHLPVGESATRYHVLQFENPPDTSFSIGVVYKRRVVDLVDDDDVIAIPSMADALKEATLARLRMVDRKYQQAGVHIGGTRAELAAMFAERDMQGDRTHQAAPDFTGRPTRQGF